DLDLDDEVELEKFGQVLMVIPKQLKSINGQRYHRLILKKLNEIQQQNPIEYEWLKRLFYHYCFVIYPFTLFEGEIEIIVEALFYLGESHFNLESNLDHVDPLVEKYVKEIELCHQMYLQILDDN